MRLSDLPLRRITKLASVLPVAGLLAGCASYGSFDENEPGLEQSVLGGLIEPLGITPEEEQIEYSARAPLVAPPSTTALPAPGSAAALATADPNWPTGSRQRMAQVMQNEDRTLVFTPGVDGVDIAATQALAERTRNATAESNAGVARRLTPEEMQGEVDIQRAREQATASRDTTGTPRTRRFLTDPPVEARAPSSQAPVGGVVEEAEEERASSWWPF